MNLAIHNQITDGLREFKRLYAENRTEPFDVSNVSILMHPDTSRALAELEPFRSPRPLNGELGSPYVSDIYGCSIELDVKHPRNSLTFSAVGITHSVELNFSE